MENKTVGYIWHKDFTKLSDDFIPVEKRNYMVHSLIESYGLLERMTLVVPQQACRQDLEAFHSADYLDALESECTDLDETPSSDDDDDYGLGYDCPKRNGLMEYCHRVAGGTIDAARIVNNGQCRLVLHWIGGWHHAKRCNASGFCYVNDCVLGILELRKKFQRVLYVDLDLHHGDGVEEAFYGTDKVATLSFHKYEPGFFPGTGSLKDTGYGRGKYFSINVPLLDGITDKNFCLIFDKIFPQIIDKYKPNAILCQCGADGLNGDPMGSFNLTQKSFTHCVQQIVKTGLPTVITGGGGYHPANTARCWTSVTAAILGVDLSEDIPEHDNFPEYGPHFELCVPQGLRKDMNTDAYLNEVITSVLKSIDCMP